MKFRVAALLLLVCFAALAYQVKHGATMALDLAVRNGIHQLASPPLTVVFTTATLIGRALIVLPLTFAIFGLLWLVRRKREAGVFLLMMAAEPPLEFGLKWLFHRPRPAAFFGLSLPSSYSFPSGHALAATLLYGGLATLLAPHLPQAAMRTFAWFVAILMIVVIGLSRIYLGVHYPTDVLAGYMLGITWICVIASTGITKRPEWRRT